jgi:8-oxo-dGTP pyrophosphatase MutT (NUDIX family)
MRNDLQPKTNAPLTNPISDPIKSSNKALIRGGQPETFSAGMQVKAAMLLRLDAIKIANELNFKTYSDAIKIAAELTTLPKLRPRSEVIVYNDEGCYAIDKGDYILFPGGGIDDGETPEQAVQREAIEEADIKLANLKPCAYGEAKHDLMEGFSGERSYFFLAKDGGRVNTSHEDREEFKSLPFDTLKSRLKELIDSSDQAWAKGQNEIRLNLVEEAEKNKSSPITKLADVVSLKPRAESIAFTPDGKLIVRRSQNRRFELPSLIGKPAPYESPISLIPSSGIPEQGAHGYQIQLNLAEAKDVPEGFETLEPEQALNEMYASMGMSANREYRELDRARARAIVRMLKKRKALAAKTEPIQPPL